MREAREVFPNFVVPKIPTARFAQDQKYVVLTTGKRSFLIDTESGSKVMSADITNPANASQFFEKQLTGASKTLGTDFGQGAIAEAITAVLPDDEAIGFTVLGLLDQVSQFAGSKPSIKEYNGTPIPATNLQDQAALAKQRCEASAAEALEVAKLSDIANTPGMGELADLLISQRLLSQGVRPEKLSAAIAKFKSNAHKAQQDQDALLALKMQKLMAAEPIGEWTSPEMADSYKEPGLVSSVIQPTDMLTFGMAGGIATASEGLGSVATNKAAIIEMGKEVVTAVAGWMADHKDNQPKPFP